MVRPHTVSIHHRLEDMSADRLRELARAMVSGVVAVHETGLLAYVPSGIVEREEYADYYTKLADDLESAEQAPVSPSRRKFVHTGHEKAATEAREQEDLYLKAKATVEEQDGMLHSGTSPTGRMASSGPNMQRAPSPKTCTVAVLDMPPDTPSVIDFIEKAYGKRLQPWQKQMLSVLLAEARRNG